MATPLTALDIDTDSVVDTRAVVAGLAVTVTPIDRPAGRADGVHTVRLTGSAADLTVAADRLDIDLDA